MMYIEMGHLTTKNNPI